MGSVKRGLFDTDYFEDRRHGGISKMKRKSVLCIDFY